LLQSLLQLLVPGLLSLLDDLLLVFQLLYAENFLLQQLVFFDKVNFLLVKGLEVLL